MIHTAIHEIKLKSHGNRKQSQTWSLSTIFFRLHNCPRTLRTYFATFRHCQTNYHFKIHHRQTYIILYYYTYQRLHRLICTYCIFAIRASETTTLTYSSELPSGWQQLYTVAGSEISTNEYGVPMVQSGFFQGGGWSKKYDRQPLFNIAYYIKLQYIW